MERVRYPSALKWVTQKAIFWFKR